MPFAGQEEIRVMVPEASAGEVRLNSVITGTKV